MDEPDVPLLLVEDEPDLREALGEYLGACGFLVTPVATAAEALAAAQAAVPGLVISDLSLPDCRGDVFLEQFHQRFPSSLLYVHSGDSTFTPPPGLASCGLTEDHIFAKPADLAEMVTRLKKHLKQKSL